MSEVGLELDRYCDIHFIKFIQLDRAPGIKMSHPYLPTDLKLPHYVPNENSSLATNGIFFGSVAVVLVVIWFYTGTLENMKGYCVTRMKMCWFVSCAVIHCILEGYFALFHKTLAGEQTILAQICEYQ